MDIKAIIKDWLPKAEAYFSTFPWKNLLTYLFFLLIAFVFWLMLFFQKQNVEGTYRLPLKYTNIPENVVFNNTLPQYIDISVTDNGSEIFKLDIRKRDSLEINVTELTEEGNTILQGEQFRQLLRTKFASSTIIRGYYPMTLSLETSELESKELVINVEKLVLGKSIQVGDLKFEGLELLNAKNAVVCRVQLTRAARGDAAAAATEIEDEESEESESSEE
jgi:hypothetical protein